MAVVRGDVPGGSGRIGPYRLLQRLGEGGMGVVHLALAPDERAVALKLLRDGLAGDPDAQRRLGREVETLRRVRHPRVAEVLDADVAHDRPYLVTRFVPGRTLEELVRTGEPLPTADVVRVGALLAQALEAIHAAGVVHRDVKPANVMVVDGDPVLIDFGIAHVADQSRITLPGLVMGTPGYLSPELAAGDPVTPATDWWGWGATLAFAATGRPPFGTGPVEQVLDAVRAGKPDLDGVDPALAAVLAAALAPEPAWRPPAPVLVAGLRGRGPLARPGVASPAAAGDPAVTVEVAPPPRPARPAARELDPTVEVPAPLPATVAHAGLPPTLVAPAPVAPGPPAAQRPPAAAPGPVQRPPAGPRPPSAQPPAAQGPPAAATPPGSPVPARSGPDALTPLAALAALAAVAAVAPGLAAVVGALVVVLARTVDRSATGLLRRRQAAGPRRTDVPAAVVALPWQVVRALVASVFALLIPALVAVSTAFLVGTALTPQSPQPAHPAALAAGAVAAALTAWWGPGGASLRRGGRACLRTATRTPTARAVTLSVLGLLVLAALMVAAQGNPPDFSPFEPPR